MKCTSGSADFARFPVFKVLPDMAFFKSHQKFYFFNLIVAFFHNSTLASRFNSSANLPIVGGAIACMYLSLKGIDSILPMKMNASDSTCLVNVSNSVTNLLGV